MISRRSRRSQRRSRSIISKSSRRSRRSSTAPATPTSWATEPCHMQEGELWHWGKQDGSYSYASSRSHARSPSSCSAPSEPPVTSVSVLWCSAATCGRWEEPPPVQRLYTLYTTVQEPPPVQRLYSTLYTVEKPPPVHCT